MPIDTDSRTFLRRAAFASCLLAALTAASATQAIEATRFEIDFYAPGKSKPVNHATVWIARGLLRIDQQPQGDARGPTLIYRGDDGVVYSVSEERRSFVEVDRATITRLEGQARRLRHEFATQLAGLPPNQRAQLERMLGISGADPRQNTDPIMVIPLEGTRTIAGVRCHVVMLERSDQLIAEGCVADWARIGLAEKDLEIFRTLANLQRDAMAARGFTPLELVPDQPFDLLTQLGGMPLDFERKSPTSGEISAIRVVSVTKERSVAARFVPPKGYARRTGGAAMLELLADGGRSGGEEAPTTPASPANP